MLNAALSTIQFFPGCFVHPTEVTIHSLHHLPQLISPDGAQIRRVDEIVDIPRRLNLNDKVIIDSKNHIELTPKEIIAVSSQVGASKIALELGYKDLK